MGFGAASSGELTVRLISADIPGALTAMEKANIPVRSAELTDPLTIRFTIERQNWRKAYQIFENRGEELEMEAERGLLFVCRSVLKRPVLVIGMILLIVLSIWAPGRIFFVQVEGNTAVPANQILEQASLCGIQFGASRREVRSEKMKNALLERMPRLQWAGVNTHGCVAVISVTERKDGSQDQEYTGISSLIAATDAVIQEITVTRGTRMCSIGQAVKAGDVLISGYTDCNICIRAVGAKGEVFGVTQRNLAAVTPLEYSSRGKIISVTKKYSLLIGKKRINFSNTSGILDGECVRIYSEKYITLPGGFQFPVAIATEQFIFYEKETAEVENPEAMLQSFMEDYLRSHMVAGRILSATESVNRTNGLCRIDGVYGCYEMIGILRPEECLPEYENYRTDR